MLFDEVNLGDTSRLWRIIAESIALSSSFSVATLDHGKSILFLSVAQIRYVFVLSSTTTWICIPIDHIVCQTIPMFNF